MSGSRRLGATLAGATLLCLGLFRDAAAQSSDPIEIGPTNIDLRNGGAKARADWIRYKLVEALGPMGPYVLARGHGNPAGYVGTINELTGPRLLGALLAQAGTTRCADIPTSGQLSGELALEDEEREPVSAWFGVGNRALPDHFEDAGTLFDKHIVVARGDERVLEIQLRCRDGESRVSGYFWQTSQSAGGRGKEVYFQRDPATGAHRLEVYMTYPDAAEHYAFRFSTETGDLVRIWTIRAIGPSGRDSSSGFAVAYRPATGTALASFLMGRLPPSDTTPLSAGELGCLDLDTNESSEACQGEGLSVLAPADSPVVGGAVLPFTIAGMAAMEVRSGAPELPTPGQPSPEPGDAGAPRADASAPADAAAPSAP